jgi:hypothetical protein
LYFTADRPQPAEADAAIRAGWPPVLEGRDWLLCEPPSFLPLGDDGLLRGRTKLNVCPDPGEAAGYIEREPDDFQAVIAALCDWSERYGVRWRLDIDGERQGRIADGRCEPSLARRMRDTSEQLRRWQREAVGPNPALQM